MGQGRSGRGLEQAQNAPQTQDAQTPLDAPRVFEYNSKWKRIRTSTAAGEGTGMDNSEFSPDILRAVAMYNELSQENKIKFLAMLEYLQLEQAENDE